MPHRPEDVTPYTFTIYRQSHDMGAAVRPVKWYEDTEYGLANTLHTVAGLVDALADPTTVSGIVLTRVPVRK
jgi:hypothetical protein